MLVCHVSITNSFCGPPSIFHDKLVHECFLEWDLGTYSSHILSDCVSNWEQNKSQHRSKLLEIARNGHYWKRIYPNILVFHYPTIGEEGPIEWF